MLNHVIEGLARTRRREVGSTLWSDAGRQQGYHPRHREFIQQRGRRGVRVAALGVPDLDPDRAHRVEAVAGDSAVVPEDVASLGLSVVDRETVDAILRLEAPQPADRNLEVGMCGG